MKTRAALNAHLLCAFATLVIAGTFPTAHATAGTPRHAPAVRLPYGMRAYAIGDSVMLDATGGLERLGVVVDAAVSRQFIQGIAIAQWLRAAGRLPRTVLIGLGTNGPFTNASFDAMMQALRGVRRVVFVTVTEPRRWEENVNSTLLAGVARWPTARLADWHAISRGRPGWFWSDGIHLTPAGAAAYARLVAGALR
jgi:hypothetical protein